MMRYLGMLSVAICSLVLAPDRAKAVDEIQVYNASIAAPGQWTVQQHMNYVGQGQKDPPFPGGLSSNRSLNGTPESGSATGLKRLLHAPCQKRSIVGSRRTSNSEAILGISEKSPPIRQASRYPLNYFDA